MSQNSVSATRVYLETTVISYLSAADDNDSGRSAGVHRRPAVKDPIVEEVHRQRAQRAAAFKHDFAAMVKDLKQREDQSHSKGVKFVTPRKRRKSRAG
jgi:hypothetical protein